MTAKSFSSVRVNLLAHPPVFNMLLCGITGSYFVPFLVKCGILCLSIARFKVLGRCMYVQCSRWDECSSADDIWAYIQQEEFCEA